ncbi:MAG TPA: methyltransferase domain-containing protein [Bryobacteraceae bacterium]|jgi:glycosyltransferase involved in cell wall biosynthesis/SAM-dependent methyltransferase
MRLAFFSPLPPVKSGIADYSAALLEPIGRMAQVDVFAHAPAAFDPSSYGAVLYQLGNNPHHSFVYEAAMKHPGVVVLHEGNMHHLIADVTIRRGDWDGYMREVEISGGAEALKYAELYVRTRQRGPQYEIPMLRTILDSSRAVIVHSDAVAEVVREHGFEGPVGKIPHGAWIVQGDRMARRSRLGLDARTPLIGIFGFLKPYKRIAESLRAFRRLIRVAPEARLILVGEAHPELPLASMIRSMGLSGHVRHIDFAPIEEFNGYIAACDVVLNLRYPTVGESSGTLLRALGMGKAVVVSDVGSFREFPDEICLKAPVDSTEEDHLFEYLNLLVSRPELARELGARAAAWVSKECSWDAVARRYIDFLEAVSEGREFESGPPDSTAKAAPCLQPEPAGQVKTHVDVPAEYIVSWTPAENGARAYVESHLTRLERTLAITPPGGPEDRVLEMGAYLHITPALKTRLGYGEVRGCYFGAAGGTHQREVTSASGETFACTVDLFDAEKDLFPYPQDSFSTVLCCELLEHLTADPLHMMAEINRILKPGGHLVLTTPNLSSLRAIAGILQGFHPQLFSAYIRPRNGIVDARHAREYTPNELRKLLEDSGFEVTLLETGPFREEPKPEFAWVEHLLTHYLLSTDLRGEGIYVVGRKTGPVRERYPAWLYS